MTLTEKEIQELQNAKTIEDGAREMGYAIPIDAFVVVGPSPKTRNLWIDLMREAVREEMKNCCCNRRGE